MCYKTIIYNAKIPLISHVQLKKQTGSDFNARCFEILRVRRCFASPFSEGLQVFFLLSSPVPSKNSVKMKIDELRSQLSLESKPSHTVQ